MFDNYVISKDAVHINLDCSCCGPDIVFHYDGKSFLVPRDSFFLVCGHDSGNETLCLGYLKGHDMIQFVDAPRLS